MLMSLGAVEAGAAGAATTFTTISGPSTTFINQSYTASSTVTSSGGIVTGNVVFTLTRVSDGAQVSSLTEPLTNGAASATFPATALQVFSSYTVAASYGGDGDFGASSSQPLTITMEQATNTTVSAPSTESYSAAGQNINLTATLSDVPATPPGASVNGLTITFTIANSATGPTLCTASGVTNTAGTTSAQCTLPGGSLAGSYLVTAAFAATGVYLSSSGTTTFNVVGGPTVTTAASESTQFALANQNIGVSATVSAGSVSVNEGSVAFQITNPTTHAVLCAASGSVSNGSATGTCVLPGGTPAGTYSIAASYSDSGGIYFSSSSSAQLLVGRAATTLVARPFDGKFSATLTNSATKTPIAGQTVTFSLAGARICAGTTNSAGVASCSALIVVILLIPTYTANYPGSVDYAPSSSTAKV
jgi:hypothetical protein